MPQHDLDNSRQRRNLKWGELRLEGPSCPTCAGTELPGGNPCSCSGERGLGSRYLLTVEFTRVVSK